MSTFSSSGNAGLSYKGEGVGIAHGAGPPNPFCTALVRAGFEPAGCPG